jgi:hypothetical protein
MRLPSLAAAALVFGSSGSVLALEILAARLLAPHVGVTLETYSGIIATVLAGISGGAWLGGRVADRWHPRYLIGPAIAAGGVLTLLAVPVVQFSSRYVSGSRITVTVGLALLGFLGPALALSMVPPMVIKLQLRDLSRTGRVAGRLSAVSTAGAIFGTLLTGYVFIAAVPIRLTLVALGVGLVAIGSGLWLWFGRRKRVAAMATLIIAAVCVMAVAVTSPQCDRDTKYYCARVDPAGPAGRTLLLDNLVHSYVDLEDPRNLRLYVRTFGDVFETLFEGQSEISVLHVGGGGFSFPRYIAETRPGSRNHVIEVDPGVTRLARDQLGLRTDKRLTVATGDGRLGVRAAQASTYDVVVGDAFGGIAVPWHLTTREFIEDIRQVLTPRGAYLVNLVDFPPLEFVKAEMATLGEVFDHVALIAEPETLAGSSGGNFIAVASDAPISYTDIDQRVRAGQLRERVYSGTDLAAFVGRARPLRDDFAPVDQLVTPPWERP